MWPCVVLSILPTKSLLYQCLLCCNGAKVVFQLDSAQQCGKSSGIFFFSNISRWFVECTFKHWALLKLSQNHNKVHLVSGFGGLLSDVPCGRESKWSTIGQKSPTIEFGICLHYYLLTIAHVFSTCPPSTFLLWELMMVPRFFVQE